MLTTVHFHAVCQRCHAKHSFSALTASAALAASLRSSWELIRLPFGADILLCAFCSRVQSKREIFVALAREAAALRLALDAPPPPPATGPTSDLPPR